MMGNSEPAEGISRAGDEQPGATAYDKQLATNTVVLGVILAVCNAAVALYYFGAALAGSWLAGAVALLLITMHLGLKERYGEGASVKNPLMIANMTLIGWWMAFASAVWILGDWPGRIVSLVIGFSWCFHTIFYGNTSSVRRLMTTLCVPILPVLGYLLWSAWSQYPIWLAVPFSISSFAMVASIATSGLTSHVTFSRLEQAKREAIATQKRLEFAIDAAGDGYFEIDLFTGAYRPNAALLQALGVRKAAPTLDGMRAGLHPDDAVVAFANLDRVRAGEITGWNQDLRVMDAAGQYRWVNMRARLLDTNGERTLLGTMTDLSDRKAMEEELRAAIGKAEASSKAKSEFLANMSHEIRTPLNGVLGMAQSLETDGLTDDQKKKVAIILDSGKALTGVLNDVLDLSKIEAGKLDISPVPGDMLHTMKRVRQLFQTAAEEKGLTITARYSSDFPQRLVYDPVRVRQCVSNLLSNAVKFTACGGVELSISSEATPSGEHMVRIDVIDTGIGMTQDVQDKLFAAFTQADGAITRTFGGTGLGLAISRQLARMMGGDITVKSVPGTGSTFSLTFKAEISEVEGSSTQQAKTSAQAASSSSMRGKRVLLTDDNAVNRQVIKLFMAPLGCQVTEATNGKEALDALATQEFDIVLLDVHMPVMDGTETIRRIRAADAAWKSVPVIALTADAMTGDRERYLGMGMTDYVSKPVDQRELSSKMHTALNISAPAEPARKAAS